MSDPGNLPGFFFGLSAEVPGTAGEKRWKRWTKDDGRRTKRGKEKMARMPRVYVEGVLYYVTAKGGHSQSIFRTPADYLEYIGLISKYKAQYGFRLFAFALLPTHLHMLVELKNNIGISSIMHDLNSLYTKVFNSKYHTKGHLFESRFKTTLAHKETCLLDLTRHIHLNPKREKIVFDPKDYPYSSYPKYLEPASRKDPGMDSEIEEVFGVLRGREEAFEKFVNGITQKEANSMKRRAKKRILGPKKFEERLRALMEKSSYQTHPTKRLKKLQKVYALLGAAALVALFGVSTFFTKQHTALRTEYDNTIALYDRTIKMLKTEQDKAIAANGSVEEYAWKIRVAQESLSDLRQDRNAAIEMARELEGYSWNIRLRQIGGPRAAFANTDTVSFKESRVGSDNLKKEGFAESNYSKREIRNGKVVWETIQKNACGETASWRGEWDGATMKGVLSRRSQDGVSRDFSFVAVSGSRDNRENGGRP
ncbi:MAG: transposase [Candidatus Omnitrophota bacterium]